MIHGRYWTCSKFADWLRGTPKPKSETMEGWDNWRQLAESKHPFRYWLADEALDKIQDFVYIIPETVSNIRYYINNRFVTRTHSLTAHPRDIKPGQWCDVGHRFLPCLFNELVNFVEVETAWHYIAWSDPAEVKKYKAPRGILRYFTRRSWRCPQAGLDSLAWQASLRVDENMGVDHDQEGYGLPTYQATAAQEILDLYMWWTVTRPARPDPYEASGWNEMSNRREKTSSAWWMRDDVTDEEREESDRVHKALRSIEEAYEVEDEAMLVRLIKIRHALWT